MAGQDLESLPKTANRADYTQLKSSGSGENRFSTLDQVVDEALPDNPSNPVFQTLKQMVRNSLSRRDANGLTVKPSVSGALGAVRDAIEANPSLANEQLLRNTTHTAMVDTGVAGFNRQVAQKVLQKIVEKRPDLADANFVQNVTRMAAQDSDPWARCEAQRTLATIARNRPDLVDSDMVKTISKTAASPIVEDGEAIDQWVRSTGGRRDNWPDNVARQIASQTLTEISTRQSDHVPTPPERLIPLPDASSFQSARTSQRVRAPNPSQP